MEAVVATRPRTCALQAPCSLPGARELCRRAREFLAETGLAAADLDGWELVLDEAANNAVQNARPADRQKPIRVEVVAGEAVVEVRVTDHTPGFDFPDVAELPDPEAESGRGLFIIRSLTDEALYLRGARENCLVLRKRRSPGAAPQPDPQQELAEARQTLDLMTEELASSYESLSAIFRFSAELQADVPTDEFARRWLDQLLRITESDWFILHLKDRDAPCLRVAATSFVGWSGESLCLDPAAGTSPSVEVRAATERVDVWFDGQTPLPAGDPLAHLGGQGCGFAHPILVNDVLVGVLVVARRSNNPFGAGQVSVIQTFADFLGIQIRNTQFQEEQVRARLITRELEIVASIQHLLLPGQLPSAPRAALAGFYRSAREVGGDYYDALPTGDGNLLLVVADVMGKGLPAALFALMFRSLVRARLDLAPRPAEFLAWLNRHLSDELDRAGMFITAQLVFLDASRGEMRVAGAGHPPLLLASASGKATEIPSASAPLGLLPKEMFSEVCHAIPEGCALMFTDGLIEARNRAGDLLGIDEVKSLLAHAARQGESCEAIKQRLVQRLHDFEQSTQPADDTAFIVIAGQHAKP